MLRFDLIQECAIIFQSVLPCMDVEVVCGICRHSSMAEQLFCKQQVIGSTPFVGSDDSYTGTVVGIIVGIWAGARVDNGS